MSVADTNRALIEHFYGSFDRHDGNAMAAAYAPSARFADPVFGELTGEQAAAMWRMFTSRPDSDLRIELREHQADATSGSARWIARYTFPTTGKRVVNDIRARFHFADGMITDHVDEFPFWTWSRQAFGILGTLIGWSPVLKAVVRRKGRADLAKFMNA
jgi:ketosteroid isomerase-like protein